VTLRSVVAGTGSALPKRRVENPELAEKVDTSDDGSSSAPASAAATSRAKAKRPRASPRTQLARRSTMRHPRVRDRPDRPCHRDSRPDFSVVGDQGSGGAWHQRLRRFRRPRRLHRIPLCSERRRRDAPDAGSAAPRWSSARRPSAGSSTGKTAPPASCSATAPGRSSSEPKRATAGSSRPSFTPTDGTTICCSSTADPRRRARSASCG